MSRRLGSLPVLDAGRTSTEHVPDTYTCSQGGKRLVVRVLAQGGVPACFLHNTRTLWDDRQTKGSGRQGTQSVVHLSPSFAVLWMGDLQGRSSIEAFPRLLASSSASFPKITHRAGFRLPVAEHRSMIPWPDRPGCH